MSLAYVTLPYGNLSYCELQLQFGFAFGTGKRMWVWSRHAESQSFPPSLITTSLLNPQVPALGMGENIILKLKNSKRESIAKGSIAAKEIRAAPPAAGEGFAEAKLFSQNPRHKVR